jgi:hypothetical protein
VNGAVDAAPSSSALSGTWLAGYPAILGARNTSTFLYPGKIDEFSVWNRELNSSEVTEIYNSGSPTDLTDHSVYNQLGHWYRMGDNDGFPTIIDQKGLVNGTMVNMIAGSFEEDTP